jgi:hypothetical protein
MAVTMVLLRHHRYPSAHPERCLFWLPGALGIHMANIMFYHLTLLMGVLFGTPGR